MQKIRNILIFPGGTEIALEIRSALCHCKEIRLFSAGSDTSNHAPFAFARHYLVPDIFSPGCVESLNRIVIECDIDFIYPAYDDVLVFLAANSAELKAPVVTSPLATCLITRSKRATYQSLVGALQVPRVYESVMAVDDYPVFVKPDKGQGAQNTHLVVSRVQLESTLPMVADPLILEFLPGEEYTIDCFSDRCAGLLFAGARTRLRTRSGISVHSRSVDAPDFRQMAEQIAQRLELHGAWFFQLKRNRKGTPTLLEVAPRIAGTMAVHRVRGVNFPLLSIYEQERIPLTILDNGIEVEIDRALISRYRHTLSYSKVYVDFDDTLVVAGQVNRLLISFIFQCIGRKIAVVLITKHTGNIRQTLREYRLEGLFDKVVHLSKNEDKADFITSTDAILIDDSFAERQAVAMRLGISTFDSSMVELLIDERV